MERTTKQLVKEARASAGFCGTRPRTVVTMSSFYGRHTGLPMVVDSILSQSCVPDAIYIFLSFGRRLRTTPFERGGVVRDAVTDGPAVSVRESPCDER